MVSLCLARLRDWRQASEMEVNKFLRSLARNARSGPVAGLALRWQELRAIELLWDELASEFGGAGPVEPLLREKAGQVSHSIRSLAREMKATRRLVEPEESILTEARMAVDDAFKKMEPLL